MYQADLQVQEENWVFPTWLQTGIARSLPQRRLCVQGMGMVSTRCTIRNYVHPCAKLQWKLVAFPHLRSLFGVDVLFNHWGTKSDYFQMASSLETPEPIWQCPCCLFLVWPCSWHASYMPFCRIHRSKQIGTHPNIQVWSWAWKRGQTPAWNDEKVIPYPVATCRDEAADSVSCRETPELEHSGERAAHKLREHYYIVLGTHTLRPHSLQSLESR